jgi:hypothetical protein
LIPEGWTTTPVIAMLVALLPVFVFDFARDWVRRELERLPLALRLTLPAVISIPCDELTPN